MRILEEKNVWIKTDVITNNDEAFKKFNNDLTEAFEVMEENNVIHVYYSIYQYFDENIYNYLNNGSLTNEQKELAMEELLNPNSDNYLNLSSYLDDENDYEY